MRTCIRYSLITLTAALVLVIAGPQQGMAQRFNHGNVGGGGGRPIAAPVQRPAPVTRPAPAFRPAPTPFRPAPAPSRPAPVPSRPVETRPAVPRQPEGRPVINPVEPRPTINGGARNFGSHDYSGAAQPRQEVRVRENITVRDHVNVYHTGGYKGVHPYYYHPYRPYYWGPHWHPVGFFLTSLAADAIAISFNNQRYFYDDGCYYQQENGGFDVVMPPVGTLVAALPPGYETPVVDGVNYFYFGGVFYIYTGQGYQVVVAPPGAVISQLPTGAVDQQIGDEDILVYNNTYYEPISQDGQDAYEVVPPPGQ